MFPRKRTTSQATKSQDVNSGTGWDDEEHSIEPKDCNSYAVYTTDGTFVSGPFDTELDAIDYVASLGGDLSIGYAIFDLGSCKAIAQTSDRGDCFVIEHFEPYQIGARTQSIDTFYENVEMAKDAMVKMYPDKSCMLIKVPRVRIAMRDELMQIHGYYHRILYVRPAIFARAE